MATIASYPVLDFSGGVRRDRGPGYIQKNELLDARNVHLDERGRITTRLGSQQLGQTLSGTMENAFFFKGHNAGTNHAALFVNNNASTGVISFLRGAVLTSTAAVGDTSLTVNDTSALAASGTLEIEGDLITYTATPSGTSITGVTGISFAHAANTPVQQWVTLTQAGVPIDMTNGVQYSVLAEKCFLGNGDAGNLKYVDFSGGAPTMVDIGSDQFGYLITNYRDRMYSTGDAANRTRVYFSSRGDGTTWTTSDWFDVPDQYNETITAFLVHNDTLGIFKIDEIFTYNEIELKQRIPDVGAYNHKVVQQIGSDILTFCPHGVFVTNLFSAKSIGEPVKEFFKNFVPTYSTSSSGVSTCNNTFAWTTGNSYFLYIKDITVPTVTNDVVLEYSTITNAWTVHDSGYTDFSNIAEFHDGRFGASFSAIQASNPQVIHKETLIGCAASGKVWRMNENRFLDSTQTVYGSDIYVDLRSNTGTPIPVVIETQMYDLTHPELFKKFKRLRVYAESGQWNLEYRIEDEKGISSYRQLGNVPTTNKILPFPSEAQGWSCGFRITGINSNNIATFSGFIFEDTEVMPRP